MSRFKWLAPTRTAGPCNLISRQAISTTGATAFSAVCTRVQCVASKLDRVLFADGKWTKAVSVWVRTSGLDRPCADLPRWSALPPLAQPPAGQGRHAPGWAAQWPKRCSIHESVLQICPSLPLPNSKLATRTNLVAWHDCECVSRLTVSCVCVCVCVCVVRCLAASPRPVLAESLCALPSPSPSTTVAVVPRDLPPRPGSTWP